MCGVPGQEIVNSVARGKRDVKGVHRGTVGKASRVHELSCESDRLGGHAQRGQVLNPPSPALSGIRIAQRGFGDNQLGYAYFENRATTYPPLVGQLLTRGSDQVPAWTRREITDDRGFEIDPLRHPA